MMNNNNEKKLNEINSSCVSFKWVRLKHETGIEWYGTAIGFPLLLGAYKKMQLAGNNAQNVLFGKKWNGEKKCWTKKKNRIEMHYGDEFGRLVNGNQLVSCI